MASSPVLDGSLPLAPAKEPRPKVTRFPFTFSLLWPKNDRRQAALIEQAIAKKQYREVITLVKKELDRVIERYSQGVPNSSETTILTMLGLDGREYLEIARRNASPPSDPVPGERALAAYLYLLQAIERSK